MRGCQPISGGGRPLTCGVHAERPWQGNGFPASDECQADFSWGEACKCIWPPKWVLMIMTRTIKELMCLLSYEQDLKSLELKRESIDAKFANGSVHELHCGISLFSILNLSIESTVLLRGT